MHAAREVALAEGRRIRALLADLATVSAGPAVTAEPAGAQEIGTAHLLATVLDTATFAVLCAGQVSGTVQGRLSRLAYAAIMAGERDGTEGDGDPDSGQRVRPPRPSLGPPGQIHLAEPEPDWGDE